MVRTFLGIAHPWLCDSMGHLNTRHYVAMFDDASAHYLSAIGWSPTDAYAKKIGWADVRGEIEYKSEVPQGGQVTIDTGTEKIGTKSVTIYSEMRHVPSGELSATMRSVIVHFDLEDRQAVPVPDEFRRTAESIGV
ncbi:MAG: acyl-CoA thioesterase [Gammaproteobacteria bacterium]|nr:acyl-CoA thioesterase [Gammaproteobacteria bacterium]